MTYKPAVSDLLVVHHPLRRALGLDLPSYVVAETLATTRDTASWASAELADFTGLSVGVVRAAVKDLHERGYVAIENRRCSVDIAYLEARRGEVAEGGGGDRAAEFTRELCEYARAHTANAWSVTKSRTDQMRRILRARPEVGIDDFKAIVYVKWAEWQGTESERYVRWDTLFQSVPAFDKYRTQAAEAIEKERLRKAQ